MPEEFIYRRPVVIVGTPRSGTSLLHRIIRTQPGFVSLARESEEVWGPLTHPAVNQWDFEGWAGERLTGSEILNIHRQLAKRALGARIWRHADAWSAGERQHQNSLSGKLIRTAYQLLVTLQSRLRFADTGRLVEKSVHNALWLDLVEQVFPDAHYVHIVRRPEENLRSMIRAWLNPHRFFTYELPVLLDIPQYPFERWNFGLPAGWKRVIGRPLDQVVAFQWAALQKRILEFENRVAGRFVRIRLEDLSSDPRGELSRLADRLEIRWNSRLETYAKNLPRVNAGGTHVASSAIGTPDEIRATLTPYGDISRAIGY